MSIKSSDSFTAFASLNRYFAQIEYSKPTLEQAEEAITFLCQIYGAETEDELLKRGDTSLIETYKEIKDKIMMGVAEQ